MEENRDLHLGLPKLPSYEGCSTMALLLVYRKCCFSLLNIISRRLKKQNGLIRQQSWTRKCTAKQTERRAVQNPLIILQYPSIGPGNAFFCDYVDPIFKGKWMHHRNSVGTSLSKGLYNAEALQKQPQANARLPQTWSASILIFP